MFWIFFLFQANPQPPPVPHDDDGDGYRRGYDCDDNDPSVFPHAYELCDGIDNDCDELIDELTPFSGPLYPDGDGDGSGSVIGATEATVFDAIPACALPPGFSNDNADCDDADPDRHWRQLDDQCDGFDDNCDGYPDNCDGYPDNDSPLFASFFLDGDLDGFGAAPWWGCPSSASSPTGGDCNDQDPSIFPGATEVHANNIDENCNGPDDDPWPDVDGDGSPSNVDCDDLDAGAHPGAVEACGNSIDDDCDGEVDEACVSLPAKQHGCTTNNSVVSGLWPLRRR